ncbi:DUF2935 domain-containing protein [Sporolituus thermophilus]|uniref:DUF2935 domain-containing protein n=1 Tax=Sporolituus thermophilus DSM 23256 TaxID=1123285 RepID=A0A1G7MH71_9FIRM|nr:DUF2935 domain-containing protein [Sporolituus thermophilus]SDF60974.1 protein of unknown function [Sporolituus thermophilus DSM 23256]
MSRPSVATGAPGLLPNAEELCFWLDILQEHALFIKLGLPCDKTDLIREAEYFYDELGKLKARVGKTGDKKFAALVEDAACLIAQFHHYKHHLVHLAVSCRIVPNLPPLMLEHMAREAEYVLRLLTKMKDGKHALEQMAKTQEMLFWVRVMEDHTYFIRGRLDPSERIMMGTVDEFSQEFDELYLQARDFAGLYHHHHHRHAHGSKGAHAYRHDHGVMPAYARFIKDVRAATVRLRDFKKAAHRLIEECKLVSTIPALLADHVRREADHFLMVLAMMDKGMMECPPDEEEPVCGYADSMECEDDFGPPPIMECDEKMPCGMWEEEEEMVEEDEEECFEDELPPVKPPKFALPPKKFKEMAPPREEPSLEPAPTPEPVPQPEPEPPKQVKPAKYKWNNWPRPLGKVKD